MKHNLWIKRSDIHDVCMDVRFMCSILSEYMNKKKQIKGD